MDKFNKQSDRKQEAKILVDVINKNYVGEVVELQNVFQQKGVKVPVIGIVSNATVVYSKLFNLNPNIYVEVEIRAAITLYSDLARHNAIRFVYIPPYPEYIQPVCDDITKLVLEMDTTWKKMNKLAGDVLECYTAHRKQDNEIGEEWQVK